MKQLFKITKTSQTSGIVHQRDIYMTTKQFAEYNLPTNQRRPIQQIFPELSADDREFLLTGTTPEEWDDYYEEEE